MPDNEPEIKQSRMRARGNGNMTFILNEGYRQSLTYPTIEYRDL
jgi:hypothetical protein